MSCYPSMKKRSDPTMLLEKANTALTKKQTKHPKFKAGDTVQVHVRVREGEKSRVQIFEGLVIRKRNAGKSSSFTVRKVSYGVGIERVFPLFSPVVEKIVIISKGDVRRAKLYYIRELEGRKARVKSELVYGKKGEKVDLEESPEESSEKDAETAEDKKAAEA